MRANYDASAGILLDTLHWDNLSVRRKKLTADLMFKTLKVKGNMPYYTSKICFLFVHAWHWVQYKQFQNTVKFAKATNKLPKTKLLL